MALYVALAQKNGSLALIALITGAVPWALFLAIPTTSRGSLTLVYLGEQYIAASPADRDVFATAAEAIIAANNTPGIAGVLSAAGLLLMGVVMVRGALSRAVGWLAIFTGAAGIVGETLRHTIPALYGPYGLLLFAWFVAVGVTLILFALRTPRSAAGRVRLSNERLPETPLR